MENKKIKGIIEAVLFSTGRIVKIKELMTILELSSDDVIRNISELQEDYKKEERGLEIVRVEDGYQLASKKEYHEYLYPAFDKRLTPTLSQASLEVLAILAYNPRSTRADIEMIRGVDSSGTMYRLLEYNLIEPSGKADLPGKPMTYKVSEEFLKMFGLKSLKELPDLPKYKLDSNRQVVIDDLTGDEENKDIDSKNTKVDIDKDVINENINNNEYQEKDDENNNVSSN